MYLPNTAMQSGLHRAFRADGSIASSSPLLILPQAVSRSMLMVQNISANVMYLEHGCARAHATISGGVVNTITMDNVGFGFTLPPTVQFLGGFGPTIAGPAGWNGKGQNGYPQPTGFNTTGTTVLTNAHAKGVAVLSGGTVASITILFGGYGYINPPEIILTNHPDDPFGCADPSVSSGTGVYLAASGGAYYINGTSTWTDAVALYCATSTSKFTAEYMV
jgi:hypothetical protein